MQNAVWTTRFDTGGNLFDFGGGAGGGTPIVARRPPTATCRRCASTCASSRRARFASRTTTRTSSRARTCTFRGTYERPIVFGSAEISRGEFIFEGRRYVVTRGTARLHEPRAHRADVRHRRRDAGARAAADLSRHAERVGHDAAPAAGVQLGSAAAAGRRGVAAARRSRDGAGCRSPRAVSAPT